MQVVGFENSNYNLVVTDFSSPLQPTALARLVADSPFDYSIEANESKVFVVQSGLNVFLEHDSDAVEMRVFNSPDFSVRTLVCTNNQSCAAQSNSGEAYVQIVGKQDARFSIQASSAAVNPPTTQPTGNQGIGTRGGSGGGSSGGGSALWLGLLGILVFKRRYQQLP